MDKMKLDKKYQVEKYRVEKISSSRKPIWQRNG